MFGLCYLVDENNMGRTPCCDEQGLRKGFWTEEEDEKLLSYIKQHGEQHWNSLPRKAGLKRCGKSCRLRWANYLKPGINRGNFTPQEEQLIIQLHSVLGSKWSAIARHLHKRTDNEIKNYWNTRIRRRLKEKGSDPTTTNTLAGSLANNSMYSENAANISTVVNYDGMYNSSGNKSDGGDGGDNNQNTNSSNTSTSVGENISDTTGANSNNVTILSSPVSTLSSSAHILNKVATTLNSKLHCLNAIKEIFSDELNNTATKIALINQSEPLIQGTGAGNSHEPPVDASISGSYNIQTPLMESLSPFYEQYMESDSPETFFEELAKALED